MNCFGIAKVLFIIGIVILIIFMINSSMNNKEYYNPVQYPGYLRELAIANNISNISNDDNYNRFPTNGYRDWDPAVVGRVYAGNPYQAVTYGMTVRPVTGRQAYSSRSIFGRRIAK